MWKLPLPDTDVCMEELVTAVTPARGDALADLTDEDKAAFLALYQAYDKGLGEPVPELQEGHIAQAVAQAVHDGYDATKGAGRLASLRARLKAEIEQCPFCGFGPITTLDHHLPRANFKALAVYARNLVPACETCNTKKGSTVVGEADDKRFINAYFANLPKERFLRTTCTMVERALVTDFNIIETPGLSEGAYRRLQYQLTRLDLNTRLKGPVTSLITSLRTSLDDAYATPEGANNVARFLTRSATHHADSFGLNHWTTALLHGLSECIPFCDGGFRIGRRQVGA
ncbi:HNH endonuclease signature motif containing protein [Paraburkholderia sp. 35.1]|uniref:HNH endonuclease signature motif containing protein n=1 Tax=Paraburkholderia sp. 35.1 TaxID=2991058 RepID=UPI003D234560